MASPLKLPLDYTGLYNIAFVVVQHQSQFKFFKDGAAERAASEALRRQEAGCGPEAVIDALADSLQFDSHVCYFDDPCDAWAA